MELRVFVYGTLKKGFSNHASYCAGVLQIIPAHVRGSLFKLDSNLPVATIAEGDILAYGTSNPFADMRTQQNLDTLLKTDTSKISRNPDASSRRKVYGELQIFDDPETRLPLLDELEEFRPGGKSTYVRVLVSVTLPDGFQTSAWIYIAGFDTFGLQRCEAESWDCDL
jgi:gamma-glutamylcyclotransferase (GGCT)/AIG2-like uncharacterized protein YtfP